MEYCIARRPCAKPRLLMFVIVGWELAGHRRGGAGKQRARPRFKRLPIVCKTEDFRAFYGALENGRLCGSTGIGCSFCCRTQYLQSDGLNVSRLSNRRHYGALSSTADTLPLHKAAVIACDFENCSVSRILLDRL